MCLSDASVWFVATSVGNGTFPCFARDLHVVDTDRMNPAMKVMPDMHKQFLFLSSAPHSLPDSGRDQDWSRCSGKEKDAEIQSFTHPPTYPLI